VYGATAPSYRQRLDDLEIGRVLRLIDFTKLSRGARIRVRNEQIERLDAIPYRIEQVRVGVRRKSSLSSRASRKRVDQAPVARGRRE
jgi:hypothetical protein